MRALACMSHSFGVEVRGVPTHDVGVLPTVDCEHLTRHEGAVEQVPETSVEVGDPASVTDGNRFRRQSMYGETASPLASRFQARSR